jgi:hypothetical protein
MPKSTKLLEDVQGLLPKKGFKPWHEKVPADLLAELEEVRRQYRSGALGGTKTGTATALSKALQARGIDIGQRGVEKWLVAD